MSSKIWGGRSPSHAPCLQTAPQLCSSCSVLLPVLGTFDSCSISFFCQRALVSLPGLDQPESKQVSVGALGEGVPSAAPQGRPLTTGFSSPKRRYTPCSRSGSPAPAMAALGGCGGVCRPCPGSGRPVLSGSAVLTEGRTLGRPNVCPHCSLLPHSQWGTQGTDVVAHVGPAGGFKPQTLLQFCSEKMQTPCFSHQGLRQFGHQSRRKHNFPPEQPPGR